MASDAAVDWWRSLSTSAPDGIAGLWFGLVQLADGDWYMYVAGTNEFDSTDEAAEWAIGPYVWWPDNRYFPFAPAGDPTTEHALEAAIAFVSDLAPWTAVPVRGVATGYDDGDFTIVFAA